MKSINTMLDRRQNRITDPVAIRNIYSKKTPKETIKLTEPQLPKYNR